MPDGRGWTARTVIDTGFVPNLKLSGRNNTMWLQSLYISLTPFHLSIYTYLYVPRVLILLTLDSSSIIDGVFSKINQSPDPETACIFYEYSIVMGVHKSCFECSVADRPS